MKVSPFAGKPAESSMLVNVPKLITAYYTEVPDPSMPEQRVSSGAAERERFLAVKRVVTQTERDLDPGTSTGSAKQEAQ